MPGFSFAMCVNAGLRRILGIFPLKSGILVDTLVISRMFSWIQRRGKRKDIAYIVHRNSKIALNRVLEGQSGPIFISAEVRNNIYIVGDI